MIQKNNISYNISILKMSDNDILSTAEIEKLCFEEPWSVNSLKSCLNNKIYHFYVAKLNFKVLGYAGMYVIFEQAYICNVAVLPVFRGNGIGKNLIKTLLDLCVLKKVESISLEVRQSNNIAIKLYDSLGFQIVGKRKNFYRYPSEDALIMTKYFKIEK